MNKTLSELLKKYETCDYLMLSNNHSKSEKESFHLTVFKVNNPENLQIELTNFVEGLLGEYNFEDRCRYISFIAKDNIFPSSLELFDYTSGVIEVN